MNVDYQSGCDNLQEISTDYKKELAYEQVFLAAAAYSDEPKVCVEKLKAGSSILPSDIDIVEVIARQCDDTIFEYKECAAIIGLSVSRKSIYVSFRGTTSISPQLILQSLSILFESKLAYGKGHVQKYFLTAYQKLSCLEPRVMNLLEQYPDFTVHFSGHSLGGALASIAAFTFSQKGLLDRNSMKLYTYGMPRVGDKLYAADFREKVYESFRVVNYKDCVTHFPTCFISCRHEGATGPYHHHTEVFYDTSNMLSESFFRVCNGNEDDVCSHKYQGPIKTVANARFCTDYHTRYFDIPVGKHCDETMNKRRKRSDVSDMSHLLSSEYCSVLQKGNDGWFVFSNRVTKITKASNISTNDTSSVTDSLTTVIDDDYECAASPAYQTVPNMLLVIPTLTYVLM
ncbi:lipase ZK262.3-like [Watersipora subatra]|uniref:lipase ZK262.3-like n=1 Tax=Watersipora subatra TaxID=2589382 RepID=UPI00355B30DF